VGSTQGQAISEPERGFGYILLVRIAPQPRPRRRVKWLLPIAALALSAAAYGCGSTGDEGPVTPAAPPSTVTGPADASVPPGAEGHSGRPAEGSKGGVAAKGTATSSPRGKQDGKGSGGSHGGGADSPPETADRIPRGGGRTASSNSGRCPSGVSRSECELIAEQVSDTPSFSVSSVEDCVKAIGKEGCERLLEAESASKGGNPPIDVNECLKTPTPRCEAALRPILEAEQAASNAKK